MLTHSENNLARVTQQLSRLEKRDWELWAIVSATGVLVSALLAILFHAAFFKSDGIHFELTASLPLAIGLFILLALFLSRGQALRSPALAGAADFKHTAESRDRGAVVYGSPD